MGFERFHTIVAAGVPLIFIFALIITVIGFKKGLGWTLFSISTASVTIYTLTVIYNLLNEFYRIEFILGSGAEVVLYILAYGIFFSYLWVSIKLWRLRASAQKPTRTT